MNNDVLTPLMLEYLKFSKDFIAKNKRSPSFVEIAKNYNRTAPTVTSIMKKLKALGYVDYDPSRGFTLRLTDKTLTLLDD